MKKESNIFLALGLLIYAIITIVDRFVIKIADYIYIPILIIGTIMIIIGFIKNRKSKQS